MFDGALNTPLSVINLYMKLSLERNKNYQHKKSKISWNKISGIRKY